MKKIKLIITNWIESEKGKDVLIVIIVILAGLGSFELGRLSKENGNSGIKIEYPNQYANMASVAENKTITQIQTSNSNGKNFFASSKGSKYYSLGCSAGKTIKQENRIYFATREEAQKAGYALSSSCN